MAVANVIISRLESSYNDFSSAFSKVKKLLHISSEKLDEGTRPNRLLALINAVYYKDYNACIDWDLLQRYWNFSDPFPPKISNKEFSDLQMAFFTMRCCGDGFASQLTSHYTNQLLREWLIQGGWFKALELFLVSFPLAMISIFPEMEDLPFSKSTWSIMLRFVRTTRLSLFDVMLYMCEADEVPEVFESPVDRSSFEFIRGLINCHDDTQSP